MSVARGGAELDQLIGSPAAGCQVEAGWQMAIGLRRVEGSDKQGGNKNRSNP